MMIQYGCYVVVVVVERPYEAYYIPKEQRE